MFHIASLSSISWLRLKFLTFQNGCCVYCYTVFLELCRTVICLSTSTKHTWQVWTLLTVCCSNTLSSARALRDFSGGEPGLAQMGYSLSLFYFILIYFILFYFNLNFVRFSSLFCSFFFSFLFFSLCLMKVLGQWNWNQLPFPTENGNWWLQFYFHIQRVYQEKGFRVMTPKNVWTGDLHCINVKGENYV